MGVGREMNRVRVEVEKVKRTETETRPQHLQASLRGVAGYVNAYNPQPNPIHPSPAKAYKGKLSMEGVVGTLRLRFQEGQQMNGVALCRTISSVTRGEAMWLDLILANFTLTARTSNVNPYYIYCIYV